MNAGEVLKKCCRCLGIFPTTSFSTRSRNTSDGLAGHCHGCQRIDGAKYRDSRSSREPQYWAKQKWYEALKAKSSYRLWKEKFLELHGNKCKLCGFSDVRALQIDHVNDDGYMHRHKNTRSIHPREMVNDTTGRFQLLCANCNWIKKSMWDERRKIKLTLEK